MKTYNTSKCKWYRLICAVTTVVILVGTGHAFGSVVLDIDGRSISASVGLAAPLYNFDETDSMTDAATFGMPFNSFVYAGVNCGSAADAISQAMQISQLYNTHGLGDFDRVSMYGMTQAEIRNHTTLDDSYASGMSNMSVVFSIDTMYYFLLQGIFSPNTENEGTTSYKVVLRDIDNGIDLYTTSAGMTYMSWGSLPAGQYGLYAKTGSHVNIYANNPFSEGLANSALTTEFMLSETPFVIVPLPSAILSGFILLGCIGGVRRIRQCLTG